MSKIIATLKQKLTPQAGAKEVILALVDLGYMVLGAIVFYQIMRLVYYWGTLAK